MLTVKADIWEIMLCVPGIMAPHFSVEYRTHFTGFHATVVGFIGATEQLIIQMGTSLYCIYLSSQGETLESTRFSVPLPAALGLGASFETSPKDIILYGACISGLHWTTENYIRGFLAAKDKFYAIGCLLPYICFNVMLVCSQYSRFFSTAPICFIVMSGLYLTYVTAFFNLNSTARMSFDYVYFWPVYYLLVIYGDKSGILNDDYCVLSYSLFTIGLLIAYLNFMWCVVSQLTNHLKISFLFVKQKTNKKTR